MLKNLQWNKEEDRNKVIASLKAGNAVLGSSDTVLGLLADSTNEGFLRLNSIKGRSEKPYLLLIHSIQEAKTFVDESVLFQIENILDFCWPGPLTLVVCAKKGAPGYLKSAGGTVALRVPDHEGLQQILSHFKGIFSTSANKAGNSVPTTLQEVDTTILNETSYCIIDNHEAASKTPSTIIQWVDGELKLIREGAYATSELEKLFKKTILRL